ncbi:hypothetical protein FNO01nite_10150 [Flavobacterium noncentrifugens]|uniref:Conserved repeat domain-containing protein/Por secretion system C-terminal sorting domain-containing protein n=1 Tax=Flavobacterium noncentrifugens TaxID=1128970 RepID=A0A1G8V6W9_9FLAO|nr:T9SS type A sorting domain-containing protein [Flavobacterium noncentrifugens]GEP50343.1 hypothetical protein FNO01nite_10150 [Flavobacterium noncentrifugens]SDJ61085.1 conserved repeat domain-containing protein/Por secretion system C-terminal sorting domain-containing protein [Flavobacterium noncentrifugens]
MKKLLLSLLLIGIGAAAQPVVNIPDANFKNALLTYNPVIDSNSDGQIQVSEAEAITNLRLEFLDIVSFEGLQAFSNLESFDNWGNPVAFIDLTQNHKLVQLSIWDAQNDLSTFDTLDLSGMNFLTNLELSQNSLLHLNISGCTSLKIMNLRESPLIDLDVSNLTQLEELNIGEFGSVNDQRISGMLNLTGCAALQTLRIGETKLTSINASGCHSLLKLDCGTMPTLVSVNLQGCSGMNDLRLTYTKLSTLDLADCVSLVYIDLNGFTSTISDLDFSHCPNLDQANLSTLDLHTLNIKNGRRETNVFINESQLEFVCMDEIQIADFPMLQVLNIPVNSYCLFTPGGNYNTIKGKVTFDESNNGCDENDAPHPFLKVKINDGTNQGSTFTNASGNYYFYTDAGNFTLIPEFENPAYFTTTPTLATVNFPQNDNSVTTQDFCLTPNAVHPDLEIVVAPLVPGRPGFNAVYQIVYKNKGNQTLSGNISFNFDDALLDFIAASIVPDAQATGLLSFNYTSLMPFESRSINVSLKLNAPTETPPVNIDDQLAFSATINPVATDETPEDNVFQYTQTVVGSFDPNDKQCLEGTAVSAAQIGKYLHYMINFENTGTHVAENVVVKDVIDAVQFDINSFQILDATDGMSVKVTGNVIEFIFEGIHLPIGGHGNVLFKIRTLENLAPNTTVSNTANIFFDYNYPIVTNRADTRFANLSVKDVVADLSIRIFPNPANDIVNIKSGGILKSVALFDIGGRLIEKQFPNAESAHLDMSLKSSGLYFVKIITDKGSTTQKLLKN